MATVEVVSAHTALSDDTAQLSLKSDEKRTEEVIESPITQAASETKEESSAAVESSAEEAKPLVETETKEVVEEVVVTVKEPEGETKKGETETEEPAGETKENYDSVNVEETKENGDSSVEVVQEPPAAESVTENVVKDENVVAGSEAKDNVNTEEAIEVKSEEKVEKEEALDEKKEEEAKIEKTEEEAPIEKSE